MWPRSHTSGLMIGECTRSSCSSSSPPRAPACARALRPCAAQHLRGVGGEGVLERGLPWLAVLLTRQRPCWRHSRTTVRSQRSSALRTGVVPARDDRPCRARGRARRSPPSRAPGARRSPGASAIQRAPSTRSMCPCEKTATSPSLARELGDHAVGARAHVGRALAAGAAVAPQVPVRARARGSRPSSGPRSRRSPTRAGPRAPAPRRRARTARTFRARAAAGSTSTSAKRHAAQPRRAARAATSRPCSVSGMSVRPVCRPLRLHSVSAWRTSTTSRSSRRGCSRSRSRRLGRGRVVDDHRQALAARAGSRARGGWARRASR